MDNPGQADSSAESTKAPAYEARNAEKAAGWLALGCVLVLAVVLAFREISALDLGFHLRAGEWILEHKRWPRTDPFTYTVTDHSYIDLHWLYQVIVVGLHRLRGPLALVLANSALILGAFGLSAATAWRRLRSPVALALLLLPCVLASELRFIVRPETLSWVFLCMTIFILERYVRGQSSPLWALPVIHLLWVNTQGLFALGLITLGIYLVSSIVEPIRSDGRRPRSGRPDRGRRDPGHADRRGENRRGANPARSDVRSPESHRFDRRLAIWAGISALACLVNPYLHKGFLFPLTQMTTMSEGSPFGETISELTSPWNLNLSHAYPFYPHVALWSYYGWAVLSVAALVLTWRGHRLREFLMFFAFMALSVKAIRNIPLFVLVSLPVTALSFSSLSGMSSLSGLFFGRRGKGPRSRRTKRSPKSQKQRAESAFAKSRARLLPLIGGIAVILVGTGLTLRVITDAYYSSDRRTDRFGFQINQLLMPVEAVEFIRQQEITGRLFNHLNYGGFLMWQLSQPVFIDGRLEVMGERFYDEYRTAGRQRKLLELLDRYEAEVVIFPYLVATSWLQQLRNTQLWRLVYYDHACAIFTKPEVYPGVRAVAPPDSTPNGLPMAVPADTRTNILYAPRINSLIQWLEGFARPQAYPREIMNTGLFHYFMDDLKGAEAFFLDALQASRGRYYEIYNNLGAVYFKSMQDDEATFCYRIVLGEQPDNDLAKTRLRLIQSR